jgi:glycosyltransferase involved in cell wall biosynthesis
MSERHPSPLAKPEAASPHVPSTAPATIVVPAYNEAEGLPEVLAGLIHARGERPWEILVIDDGSTDATSAAAEQLREKRVQVIRHPVNRGYGAALRTGIRAATHPIVVTFDADGQHDPADVERLIAALGDAAMVVGARKRGSHRDWPRAPGKAVLGVTSNFLVGQRIPDLNSGLRVFRREVIMKYLHLLPDGFSASTTSTIALLKRGHAVAWVPIRTRVRTGRSMVRPWRHGPGALLLALRLITLFDPLRVFLPPALLLMGGGTLTGAYYFVYAPSGIGGVSTGSLLLYLTGVILFFSGLLADQLSALRLERYE